MTKQFNLLKAAAEATDAQHQQNEIIRQGFALISESEGIEPAFLCEKVTHVIMNLLADVEQGKDFKIMHSRSVASFLAGVERISNALPTLDDLRKERTIKMMTAASIGTDGYVTHDVALISQLGLKHEQLYNKYLRLVTDYINSVEQGKPNNAQLSRAVRALRMKVDQAMAQTSAAPEQSNQQGGFEMRKQFQK